MPGNPIQLQTRACNPHLLARSTGLHPVVQRVLSARDIDSFDDIDYSLARLLPPQRIHNLQQAADMVARHVQAEATILIFGDYDADGATSTALCVRALRQMGHDRLHFLMPDRLRDGYGVSTNAAENIIACQPQLVITVDTGIASFDGLERLHQAGIAVVVTDHHLPASRIPQHCTIVNPNASAESEGKALAGVGVAFYLMLALRGSLRESGWFRDREEPNLAACLDLVAIGTVADLVPLDYQNRILVSEGLRRLRAGACSAGILALIRQSGRNLARLDAQDIAFALAPRINAAGRLDDMTKGVRLLLSEDAGEAPHLAQELDAINSYRRELQGQMTQQALAMLPDLQNPDNRFSHVLFDDDWHEGIVGIIASKVKDETYRPTICFAASGSGLLKGSGRSVQGIHLRDMLDLAAKTDATLIHRFGGHAMAAGLTIQASRLDRFRQVFEDILQQHANADVLHNRVECDGEIDARDLSLELADELEQAGPWGQKFSVPSFSGEFRVLDQRVLANRHLKFVLAPAGDKRAVDAILFYASEHELKTNYRQLSIHYELNRNEFRGESSLQLLIRHIL